MVDIRQLYQEMIIDHGRKPRNFGELPDANRHAEGINPLCGDEITVHLKLSDDGVIEDVRFDGHGCAISTASASLMSEALKGRTREEAMGLFEVFHELVTGQQVEGAEKPDLGKLEVLGGVKAYPTRIKCATLAWHTLAAALKGENKVSTEETGS